MTAAYDLIIIGAGPVGLFATFYAGMRELKTLTLEALPKPGGQPAVLYPEKYLYDVAGFPAVTGQELVQRLWEQANQFDAAFHFNEQVTGLEVVEPRRIRLTTARGVYHSGAVVLATGIGAFGPRRLTAPGVAEFEGKGVEYVVRRKEDFLGKRLLIVGGGDSALDWALQLVSWSPHITLIHRSNHFKAHESSVAALRRSPVVVMTEYELKEVRGDDRVREVVVRHKSGAERTLAVDAVLIFVGYKADLGPIKTWGLDLRGKTVNVTCKMETNLPGVFAAGDITNPVQGVRLNLITNGFAQAALAVNMAKHWVHPQARLFPGHSSQKKGLKTRPTPGHQDRVEE
ncbi:MAG TPA: NAD(P)/FAD-dependent oxidoreductase [Anaerolineae bacterium]|nr:NAD(P)/FAD-dependent oxidoreductase [Anaerolineae bacterium]